MNEAILGLLAVIDAGVMLVMFAIGRDWLYGCITVNLLLVSIFGAKLIPVFGLVTNMGNVFYAMVYFGTFLLLEYGAPAPGARIVWTGAVSITLFTILSQVALFVTGSPVSTDLSIALNVVFANSPRIALASIVAFVVAQLVAIRTYRALRVRYGHRRWWLRAVLVIVLAQAVDSLIFFTVGFAGILVGAALTQALFGGFMLKVVVGFATVPLLYVSRIFASAR